MEELSKKRVTEVWEMPEQERCEVFAEVAYRTARGLERAKGPSGGRSEEARLWATGVHDCVECWGDMAATGFRNVYPFIRELYDVRPNATLEDLSHAIVADAVISVEVDMGCMPGQLSDPGLRATCWFDLTREDGDGNVVPVGWDEATLAPPEPFVEVSAAAQDGPELPDVIAMGKGDARC